MQFYIEFRQKEKLPHCLLGVMFFPRCQHSNSCITIRSSTICLICVLYNLVTLALLQFPDPEICRTSASVTESHSEHFSLSDSFYPAGGLLAGGVFASGLSNRKVCCFFFLLCFIPLYPLPKVLLRFFSPMT